MPTPAKRPATQKKSGGSLQTAFYESIQSLLNNPQIASEDDLADVVERRLPTRAVKLLIKNGLLARDVYKWVIPRRTLEHREERREPLTTDESDKVVRMARIVGLAEAVFGEKERAWLWLEDADQFSGKTAIERASTAAGARQVEERLYQIYYGIFG